MNRHSKNSEIDQEDMNAGPDICRQDKDDRLLNIRGLRWVNALDITYSIFLIITIPIAVYYWPDNELGEFHKFEQLMVIGCCLFLCIGHRALFQQAESLAGRFGNGEEGYIEARERIKKQALKERWTLSLVTITLPLGLSLVSEVFGVDGILEILRESRENIEFPTQVAQVAFHFSESVFFVMVTLEIAYLYDVDASDWRSLVTASIVLNLIGFALFLLVGQPTRKDQYIPATIIMIALSGVCSLVSSFNTISYARVSKGKVGR